jgi:hypothetical protein
VDIFEERLKLNVAIHDFARVPGGKAAESQRLFRRRQETGIALDCVVVEAVPIGPVSA